MLVTVRSSLFDCIFVKLEVRLRAFRVLPQLLGRAFSLPVRMSLTEDPSLSSLSLEVGLLCSHKCGHTRSPRRQHFKTIDGLVKFKNHIEISVMCAVCRANPRVMPRRRRKSRRRLRRYTFIKSTDPMPLCPADRCSERTCLAMRLLHPSFPHNVMALGAGSPAWRQGRSHDRARGGRPPG